MKLASRWGAALALIVAAPAGADYLPDPVAAEKALWAAPYVEEARAELDAQTLRSRGLALGREEWTVSGDLARRRVDTAPRGDEAEWGVLLSRPVRLPARAAADRDVAGAQTAYAEASLGEALHESGRALLDLWFAWLDETSQTAIWRAQLALAEQQLDVVNARIRLGEAARAERVQAEAARAEARLQMQQADAREQLARNRLAGRFPELPVPPDAALPPPERVEGTAVAHAEAVLAHNHELLRARRKAELGQATARQLARQDRPDPHVGVFYKNEAGGNEHVLGLNVGVTLPGAARRADRQAAARLSESAQAAVVRLERRLRQEARTDFDAAASLTANWRQAEDAARAQDEAARLAALAYGHGEGSLDQVLVNRRLALESRLTARQAQVAALAAQARLKLDSHRLWPLDVDADAHHAHP